MAYTLKFKRYSSAGITALTGADGELIIDTTEQTVTVHDGSTVGGSRLATEFFATSSAGYQISQNSSVVWTNSSPSPGSIFKTIISATSSGAILNLISGMPGFGTFYSWYFDTSKITFPDATIQTTAWTSNLLTSYTLNASLTSTLASYTTNDNLTSTLNSYATKTFVTSALTSYTLNANLTSTLVSYTTNTNLTSTLASYTTNTNLTSTLASYTLNVNLTSTLASYQLITSTLTLNNLTANTITVTGIGIRMTSRPSFRVFGNSSTNWNVTSNTTGILNNNNFTVEHNQGNYLNTSTGVFTAPIGGLYQICLNARLGANNTMSQIVCYKQKGVVGQETILVMWESLASGTAVHFGVSTVANLTSGQTLGIYVTAGTINFDSNDSWSVTYLG